MQIKNFSDSTIYDAGKIYAGVGASPYHVRRVKDHNGKWRQVRLPPMPYKKYVDLIGSVRNIPLTNGGGQRATETAHAWSKCRFLEDKGFVAYSVCPLTTDARRHLPDEMQGRTDFCDPQDFGRGLKYGDHQGCPHVEELIAIRHGNNKRANEIREEQRKNAAQRKLEMEEQRNAAVFEQLAALTAAVSSNAQGNAVPSGDLLKQISGNDAMMELLNQMRNASAEHPDKAVKPPKKTRKGKPIPSVDDEDDGQG